MFFIQQYDLVGELTKMKKSMSENKEYNRYN